MGLISRVSSRTYRPILKKKFSKNHQNGRSPSQRKRTFKKFSYRGIEMDKLLDLSTEELFKMFNCRHRRSFRRGVSRKHNTVINRMAKAKKNMSTEAGAKPAPVKTHCRNLTVLPQMVGNIVGVYNGKQFLGIEIKAEMIGTFLGEYGITYKPTRHGRAGIGATPSSRFIPLK